MPTNSVNPGHARCAPVPVRSVQPNQGGAMSTIATLADAARSQLTGFAGELVGPGDAAYDEARSVYNAMINRHPALIAYCTSPADVAAVIAFARSHDAVIAIRGGGHNGGGLGVVDD